MDPWLNDNLVCPRDHQPLDAIDDQLVCRSGHKYDVVQSVPVLLLDDVQQTQWVSDATLRKAADRTARGSGFFTETLGVSHEERASIDKELETYQPSAGSVDPVVRYIVAQTSGLLYKHLVGELDSYPIPDLRLPPGNGELLLDVGCNWGRWSVAAGRRGYTPVGIDPSLGAVLAARRVCRQLGIQATYVVGDARFLPFREGAFDVVFSFGVLQHFAKEHARDALREVSRVLKTDGTSMIQLPNAFGVRSVQNRLRRGFREPRAFEVRYWTPSQLRKTCTQLIGKTSLAVDGYFGLGIQPSDVGLLPPHYRFVVHCSEALRRASRVFPWMKFFADSLYVMSTRGR